MADPHRVQDLLRAAAQARALCSVRAAGRPESYLSRVLALDEASGAIELEGPRAPVIVRALATGATAAVSLKIDEQRCEFDARVDALLPRGRDVVLRLAPPADIALRQRRESFRVPVPQTCELRLTIDASDPLLRDLRLHNVSLGGSLVAVTATLDRFEPGRTFEGALLVLPDGQRHELSVRVRHASAVRLLGQLADLRVGLQFLRVSPALERALAGVVDESARSAARAVAR